MAKKSSFKKQQVGISHKMALRLVAGDWPGLRDEPLSREPPYVVVGVADIGQLSWCEAKATFSQTATERGYAVRVEEIASFPSEVPDFSKPHDSVFAFRAEPPFEEPDESPEEKAPKWATVEMQDTKEAWGMEFAAAFDAPVLGIDVNCLIIMVGVTDGVLSDGTVLEIRQSDWDWEGVSRNLVTIEKETQANIYSVLLGLKRWRCVFHCRDGRFVTEGRPDATSAFKAIKRGINLRLGRDTPSGVPITMSWKCENGRCEYLDECKVTPLRFWG